MHSGTPEPTESGAVDDVREHEEEARGRRTSAEADRAAAERDAERPPAGGDADQAGGLAQEADRERHGVMRPPEGATPE